MKISIHSVCSDQVFLASQLASIHVSEACEDLLSKIGKNFLSNLIYPAFINDSNVIIVTANHEKTVVGFCAITLDFKNNIINAFKNNFLQAIKISFSDVLIRPALYCPLLASLRMISPAISAGIAEIFMIAVLRNYQNQGIGSKLLESMSLELKKRNIPGCIARVKKANAGAIKIYQKAAFRIIGEATFNNVEWFWMKKNIERTHNP